MVDIIQGATIPHIYFKDYKKEKLWLPEIIEQNQIVNTLEKIEGIIAKREKLKAEVQKSLDETQQLFDGLMQKYFG